MVLDAYYQTIGTPHLACYHSMVMLDRARWVAYCLVGFVAQRVSPVRPFSTREIKGVRVAEVSRIRAACTLALGV
jgi:hypothetical protein